MSPDAAGANIHPSTHTATEAEIAAAAVVIRNGGLVAFPTETVYGLGANALDATAVERIFATKGRPKTSPLIVHVASVEQARQLAAEWPQTATKLAERFWPGPLTLVLRKAPIVPDRVTAGLPTVGIRMPAHPVARRLIELAGVPIAAPSANRFMAISPTLPGHVRASLADQAPLLLEGGASEVGIESTVLSLITEPPRILRLGSITREALAAVIGNVEIASGTHAAEDQPHAAPGMHQRHYSPRTPLLLWTPGDPIPTGRAFWLRREHSPAHEPGMQMPHDAQGYAQQLYRALHEADATGVDLILVEAPPATTEWEAITDRLRRAATR